MSQIPPKKYFFFEMKYLLHPLKAYPFEKDPLSALSSSIYYHQKYQIYERVHSCLRHNLQDAQTVFFARYAIGAPLEMKEECRE